MVRRVVRSPLSCGTRDGGHPAPDLRFRGGPADEVVTRPHPTYQEQAMAGLTELEAMYPESEALNVVVGAPMGSRSKFEYDPHRGLFRLGGVLPLGAVFPFDFGFVPSTVGGDGDPLDVLLLMDGPAFPGCLVLARLDRKSVV